MCALVTLPGQHWQTRFSTHVQNEALTHLEQGQVPFLPELQFALDKAERALLTQNIANPNTKNISYCTTKGLKGTASLKYQAMLRLEEILVRFKTYANTLVSKLLPYYTSELRFGRTSLRTFEAAGRVTSPKKDDNRLHVDAFPSMPMGNDRILRVFSNINFEKQPRVWHIGEAFDDVIERFLPHIKPPLPGSHQLLKWCRITKQKRSLYDHYMLNIHNKMKLDTQYQRQVPKIEVKFPANSTWLVFTDITSHAAISGQYMLEQTFYLPYTAMHNPELSPQAKIAAALK